MHSLRPYAAAFCLALIILAGCGGGGGSGSDPEVILSGTFEVPDGAEGGSSPVIAAVVDSVSAEVLENQSEEAVIEYAAADREEGKFRLDLTGKADPGNEVFIIAFLDKNYSGDVPFPDPGDWAGIYAGEGGLSPGYKLREGVNAGIHIDINRRVFDYRASVSGAILGDEEGPVLLAAYAGGLSSSDFSSIDYSNVMGYAAIDKPPRPIAYTLDILPYGKNVPIEGVLMLALLDSNDNGSIDRGDKLGLAQDKENLKASIRVDSGENQAPEIRLNRKVYEFDSSINYSVDLDDAGGLGRESRLIVMAVHVQGVEISISGSLDIEPEIDLDYLLGIEVLQAAEYESKMLPVWEAVYEELEVYEDAVPPDPLIQCCCRGTVKERTAYLFAILDKNGNLALDSGDELGYYSSSLNLPTPIARITKGGNRNDDAEAPYLISSFFKP